MHAVSHQHQHQQQPHQQGSAPAVPAHPQPPHASATSVVHIHATADVTTASGAGGECGGAMTLHGARATADFGRMALGPSSSASAAGIAGSPLSLASISLPIPATCADFDDAIMESVETELFEGEGGLGHFLSNTSVFTTSQYLSGSSSAMACLAQGFSRLPDGAGSGGARGGGAATLASASASAAAGAGNGTACATLTEALRGGSGAAAAAATGAAAATAGTGVAAAATGAAGISGGTLICGSVLALDSLAMKSSGISHDGVLSGAYDRGGEARMSAADGATGGAASQVGSLGKIPMRHPGLTLPDAALEPNPTRSGARSGGAAAPVRHTAARQHRSASAMSSNPPVPLSAVNGHHHHYHHQAPWTSCTALDVAAYGNTATGGTGAVWPSSSSASNAHQALPQVLAASGVGVGAVGGAATTAATVVALPYPDLNLPFASSRDGALGGGSGAPTSLAPRSQSLSWDMGPIGPIPVVSNGGGSVGPCLSGSIAAAAFRSASSITGHPSLAVPHGGGATAAAASASSSLAGRGSGLVRDAVGGGGRRRCQVTLSYSEPTSAVAGKAGEASRLAAADTGVRGGVGTHNAMFPAPNLFDVLPDISAGTADQDGGGGCGGGAAAGAPDADMLSAAVRALLRLDQPLDLPYTQKLPPPDYAAALQAPSASSESFRDVDADRSLMPVLPPMPVPASHLASLEPSGVAAVDRYLQQLLQDTSTERHMFLCKRPLGVAACRAVASCMKICAGIKSITLSYCSISCEGVAALCEGLRACRHLLVLDLSYNSIGDDGAAALADCLAEMPLLASLTLAGNLDLTDAGVASLAAAARGCGALRRVGLRGTAASPLGLKELGNVLAGHAKRASRRGSGVVTAGGGGGGAAVVAAAAVAGGGFGGRPITWDGTQGSAAAAATSDAVFIAQLCALLRTLVQPALAAEQAVAEAVAELMAAMPGPLAGTTAATRSDDGDAASGDASTGTGAAAGDLLPYLADGLTARGYDVAVTHALGGGSGGECLRNLRHTFLAVSCPLPQGVMPSGPPSPAAAAVAAASLAQSANASGGRRRGSALPDACGGGGGRSPLPYHPGIIIVDPELREQFEVAMPTPRYEALVSALPLVYVGAEERLPLVVEVLCDEMGLALRSKGMVVPPWRESSAMISKWQPKQSKLFVPGAASGGGGGCDRGGPGMGSGSGSARSSASVTPRVSLAGGMAAAGAAGGGGGAVAAAGWSSPVPMHLRRHGGGGGGGGGGGAVTGRDAATRFAIAAAAAAAADAADDGEPSLGPAPSLGSASSSRHGSIVQSFGFRRCTSTNSLSVSVGLMAPMGAAAAAAAAAAVAAGPPGSAEVS